MVSISKQSERKIQLYWSNSNTAFFLVSAKILFSSRSAPFVFIGFRAAIRLHSIWNRTRTKTAFSKFWIVPDRQAFAWWIHRSRQQNRRFDMGRLTRHRNHDTIQEWRRVSYIRGIDRTDHDQDTSAWVRVFCMRHPKDIFRFFRPYKKNIARLSDWHRVFCVNACFHHIWKDSTTPPRRREKWIDGQK